MTRKCPNLPKLLAFWFSLPLFFGKPGDRALALDAPYSMSGHAGRAQVTNQKAPSSGGYGQAGWSIHQAPYVFTFTAQNRRLRNVKSADKRPLGYTLEMESLGFKAGYRMEPLSFGVMIEGGRMQTFDMDEDERHIFGGGQISTALTLFSNEFIKLYIAYGHFFLVPERSWREAYFKDNIQGGSLALGIEIAYMEKDF